jgi:hypothetical protein
MDLLLDENNDLRIEYGDFVLGESELQEVGIILQLNQGELRSDPLLGPNLVRLINSKASPLEVQTMVKVNLERDGKDYEKIKDQLQFRS